MKQIDNGVVMKRSKKHKISEYLIKENGYSRMFDSIFQNQIHELSKQGKSIRDIARKLGISRQSVRKYMNGIQKPKVRVQDSFIFFHESYKLYIHEKMGSSRNCWECKY